MGFVHYVLENFTMLYELLGLVVILGVSAHLSQRMKRLTVTVVILLFLESVVFSLEQWTQTFERLSVLRPILTAILYSIYPLILMTLTLLTETNGVTRRSLFLAVPWIISVPLFFFSQWTHLVVWYHEENHFAGGPLRYLPYALFLFYIVVFFVQNVRYFRSYSRMNRVAARYIVFGAVAGVVLYFFFDGLRDYSAIFTSAILLYYVLVYIHMARMDRLTSLPNRQSFYQDLEMEAQSISGIIGPWICASRAELISPVLAYCNPAWRTSSRRGLVTTSAEGTLNMGLSGMVMMVWFSGNISLNWATAASKLCLLLGKPHPQIIRYFRRETSAWPTCS